MRTFLLAAVAAATLSTQGIATLAFAFGILGPLLAYRRRRVPQDSIQLRVNPHVIE